MQRNYKQLLTVWLTLLSLITACAGLQTQVTVGQEKGEKELAIKAGSFKFQPNNIKAYAEDILMLKVENISGTKHNFTIKDPQGRIIQNIDLPAKKTVEVRVTLSETGTYTFYCDKPFHSLFGMKGHIEVLKK